LLDGDRRCRKPIQHDLHFAVSLGRVPQHHDGNFTASLRQMPRRHQAVTADVAFAAQHRNAPALGQFTQNKAGNGVPGMLHQLQRRDPEAVRSDPVGDPHLVSSQYLHCKNPRAFTKKR
jgi:hypothetical protein